MCNILNQSISSSTFPEQAKTANVRSVFKKVKSKEITNPSQFYQRSQKSM